MQHKIGKMLMLIGVVCIVCALSLFAYNQYDAYLADLSAQQIQDEIDSKINNKKESPSTIDPNEEMTSVQIDGYEYIGYVSIPSLSIDLPVMKDWSYAGMKIAPGRYYGSVYTDNMIICAHNYPKHFNNIRYLQPGAVITFTDMEGRIFKYEVTTIETLYPDQVNELISQDNDDWDLTLFTCNKMSLSRCVVRCVRV